MRSGQLTRACAILAFTIAASTVAVAKPVIPLKPASLWDIHYAPDSCLLLREFGEGPNRVLVRFEQFAPSGEFELSLVGEPFRTKATVVDITATFGPGGKPDRRKYAATGLLGDAEKRPLIVVGITTIVGRPPTKGRQEFKIAPAVETAVNSLRVDVAGMPSALSLDLGSMGEPMKAMRACTDELLDHWGLDAAAQRSLQRLPVPVTTPQRWFEATSYPDNAAGLNGYVHFRLTVDATGAVQDCAIPSATKGSVLAKATCETLKRRARFKPAIDQSGKPVSSYYADTVRWYFLD